MKYLSLSKSYLEEKQQKSSFEVLLMLGLGPVTQCRQFFALALRPSLSALAELPPSPRVQSRPSCQSLLSAFSGQKELENLIIPIKLFKDSYQKERLKRKKLYISE